MYKMIKLYDRKALDLKLKGIDNKCKYRARKYAEIVLEENNLGVKEDIELRAKQYGEKETKMGVL